MNDRARLESDLIAARGTIRRLNRRAQEAEAELRTGHRLLGDLLSRVKKARSWRGLPLRLRADIDNVLGR